MTFAYDPERSIASLVEQIATLLHSRGERLATAESCTGGLIAAACTDMAGSSAWFERGYVTYSNAAKQDCLGVNAGLIEAQGAVSEAVVGAMLEGSLTASSADWVVAVSGVAGPGGGSADKPVGTVFIGWARRGGVPDVVGYHFEPAPDEPSPRQRVREDSVIAALAGLRERLDAQ